MSERLHYQPPEQERPLPKTADFRYHYRGYWDDGGICRVRIFAAGERTPVIVASQLPENTSTSITNMAEFLAAEVVAMHCPWRFEAADPFIWLEEYPPLRRRDPGPMFTSVRFASYTPRVERFNRVERVKLGRPTWQPIPRDAVAALIGEAELVPSWREKGRR